MQYLATGVIYNYYYYYIIIIIFFHKGAVWHNFPQQSHSGTELVVKDWPRNAKDRDGGCKNRISSPNMEIVDFMQESD